MFWCTGLESTPPPPPNMYRRVIPLGHISLGLLDPNNFWHGFSFPRPGFSKKCWGMFPSALRHQHVQKSRFTQPDFSKTCWDTFPSASWYQHVQKSRFTRPWEPNQVCASLPSIFWTQTFFFTWVYFLSAWFLKNLLGIRFPQLHVTNMSFHSALRT